MNRHRHLSFSVHSVAHLELMTEVYKYSLYYFRSLHIFTFFMCIFFSFRIDNLCRCPIHLIFGIAAKAEKYGGQCVLQVMFCFKESLEILNCYINFLRSKTLNHVCPCRWFVPIIISAILYVDNQMKSMVRKMFSLKIMMSDQLKCPNYGD